MKKIIIIDGYAIIYRIFYATINSKNSTTSPNYRTVFCFINTINTLISKLDKDDLIFVGFDSTERSFRKKEFDQYKENRKPMPEELKQQIPIIYEFLNALNIKYFAEAPYEGDDICGSLAKLASKNGYDVFIYTSDRDFLQLVDEKITINIIQKGISNIKIITNKNIEQFYGFKPCQLTDFKGLVGDSSDNLPGIPKIGDKTAIILLKKYDNLQNLIQHADELNGKLKENLINFAEQGLKTKSLATIKTDIEFPFSLQELSFKNFNIDKINDFCKKYKLKNIFQKLLKFQTEKTNNFIVASDLPFYDYESICLWILTNNNNEHEYYNTFIKSIFVKTTECTFIIHNHQINNAENLKKILKDEKIPKYTYNFKKIKILLNKINIPISGLKFDLLLASQLLNYDIENDINNIKQKTNNDINYALECIMLLTKLKNDFLKQLENNQMLDYFNNIELPISNIFADMETESFTINKNELEKIKDTFTKKYYILSNDIFNITKEKINIDNQKQFEEILNKKKLIINNTEEINNLQNYETIDDKILKYKNYSNIISLIDEIIDNIQNNKIYLNQIITKLFQFASVDNSEEKEIKKMFCCSKNECYLSFTYSQIELKILAILSQEAYLIDAFKKNKDVYLEIAKKIFNINQNPTNFEIKIAKEISNSIIFGIHFSNLGQKINKNIDETQKIIDVFFEKNKNIKKFLEKTISDLNTQKYTETFFNKKHFLNKTQNNQNFHTKEFIKRDIINTPIFGTISDIIKIAIIKIYNFLNKKNYKSKLIIQINNKLIFKIPSNEKNELIENITNIMENFDCFPIKLTVNIN